MPNFERLTILRDTLRDTITDKRFDMAAFFSGHGDMPPNESVVIEKTCGMVACMGGWACTIPAFQQAGLKVELDTRNLYPWYDGSVGFGALEKFFDLTENEAAYLFDSNGMSLANVDDQRKDWTVSNAVAHLSHFIEHYDEVVDHVHAGDDDNDDDDEDYEYITTVTIIVPAKEETGD